MAGNPGDNGQVALPHHDGIVAVHNEEVGTISQQLLTRHDVGYRRLIILRCNDDELAVIATSPAFGVPVTRNRNGLALPPPPFAGLGIVALETWPRAAAKPTRVTLKVGSRRKGGRRSGDRNPNGDHQGDSGGREQTGNWRRISFLSPLWKMMV